LATVTFTNESASGWQEARFATPVAIAADTVYVASYLAPQGQWYGSRNYFATAGVLSGPLYAFRDGDVAGNGVYAYGAAGQFPNGSYEATYYWVDVVFETQPNDPQ
jgi:hypothetical protein